MNYILVWLGLLVLFFLIYDTVFLAFPLVESFLQVCGHRNWCITTSWLIDKGSELDEWMEEGKERIDSRACL